MSDDHDYTVKSGTFVGFDEASDIPEIVWLTESEFAAHIKDMKARGFRVVRPRDLALMCNRPDIRLH